MSFVLALGARLASPAHLFASSNDEMGTVLGGGAIILLSCFVAAGLLLIHLFLSFLGGSSTRVRDFERLAVAWWVVSGVIVMAGLVVVGASPDTKPVMLLLAFGVPAFGAAMGALASRSGKRLALAPPSPPRSERGVGLLPAAICVALSVLAIGWYAMYATRRARAIDVTQKASEQQQEP